MQRILSLLLSFSAVAMLFSATAASAATYRATLATPSAERIVIVHRAPWRCAGDACVSSEVRSRPAIACGAVARELGALTAFATDEAAFGAEELAACNEYARD